MRTPFSSLRCCRSLLLLLPLFIFVLSSFLPIVATNTCIFYLGGPSASNDSKTCGSETTPCDSLVTITDAISLTSQSHCHISGTKTNSNLQILVNDGTYAGQENCATFPSMDSFALSPADPTVVSVVFDSQQAGPSLTLSSISNVNITGNVTFTATGNGIGQGCIVMEECDNAAFALVVFDQCSSSSNGGGLSFSGLQLSLQSIVFSQCNSSMSGGAVYAAPPSKVKNSDVLQVSISGCEFDDNGASLHGGALYISAINSSLVDNKFSGNKAYSGAGGAIVLQVPSSTTTTNTVFSRLDSSLFGFNIAQNAGALLAVGSYASISITNCSFYSNNAAEYGGAISFNSTQDITITKSSFTSNVANVAGGALSCYRASNTAVNSTTFAGNGVMGSLSHSTDIFSIQDSCGSPFWQLCPCNSTTVPVGELTDCDQTSCSFGTCAFNPQLSTCYCFYQPSCQLWSSDAPVPLDLTWLYIVAGVVLGGLVFVVSIAVIFLIQSRRQNQYESISSYDEYDRD